LLPIDTGSLETQFKSLETATYLAKCIFSKNGQLRRVGAELLGLADLQPAARAGASKAAGVIVDTYHACTAMRTVHLHPRRCALLPFTMAWPRYK
jgi:hypothetical protein